MPIDHCYRKATKALMTYCCLTVLLIASRAIAADPITVSIPSGVGDWAVHQSSGRVFASLPSKNVVVEYDYTGKEVRQFDVGKKPSELVIKGNMLIVACTDTPSLDVFDLNTNSSKGSIAISGIGPFGLFCSAVDNSFVYCCKRGSSPLDGAVVQCDLTEMEVRKHFDMREVGNADLTHVAMSHDGKWILTDRRKQLVTQHAELFEFDEESLAYKSVRNYYGEVRQIVSGPYSRWWIVGDSLFPIDLTAGVRKFSGYPVAVHPQLDLAASRAPVGMRLERFSDATLLATIPLPAKLHESSAPVVKPGAEQVHGAFDPTIEFDLKHNYVFYGDLNHGRWIDLIEYKDKLSLLRMIHAPSKVIATVGQRLNIQLPILNSDDTVKLTMLQGPKTAQLEGGALTWLPLASDVGTTKVRLELKTSKEDRVLDTADISLHVSMPKIHLGFFAKSMSLSANERFLVVWGYPPQKENGNPSSGGADQIVVIDVRQRKIISSQIVAQGVRCATIDDKHVYVALASGNVIYRLSHSFGDSQRLFLKSPPLQLVKLGQDQLLAVSERPELINTSSMELLPPLFDEKLPPGLSPHFSAPGTVQVLGPNEIRIGGRIVERTTGKAVEIKGSGGLPMLVRLTSRFNYDRQSTGMHMVSGWGRRILNGQALVNHRNDRIVAFGNLESVILSRRWPLVIATKKIRGDHAKPTRMTMEFSNLIDGKIEDTIVLDVSDEVQSPVSFLAKLANLIETESEILWLNGKSILIASIPQMVTENVPVPVHFVRQPVTELSSEAPAKVKLAVAGNTQGAKFSLLEEYPGIDLNSQTGELVVDTPLLWRNYVFQASSPVDANYVKEVVEFANANAAHYQALTGKVLAEDQIATQLPISAVVQNAEGHEDSVQFCILVVGPRKTIGQAVATKAKELADEQAAAKLEAMRKMAEQRGAKPAQPDLQRPDADTAKEKDSVEMRLDSLESRMRRIEAALDSVLKRLDER